MNELNYQQLIQEHAAEFLTDLKSVLQIPSVKGPAATGEPFGSGPRAALEQTLKLAESYGFQTKTIGDAVGYAAFGESSEYIGVVGHLDVVAAGSGWDYPPFDLSEDVENFYGRGILDNKGPILACLFALKLLKDAGFQPKRQIRIIFGTDEESGSADLPLYLAEEQPPIFGFTPDGKYSVVYGERGVVNYQLRTAFSESALSDLDAFNGDQARDHVPDELTVTYQGKTFSAVGKRAPSNAPDLGLNAITLLAEKLLDEAALPAEVETFFSWLYTSFHQKHAGEGLNIAFEDADSGKLMITPYQLQKDGKQLVLDFAVRYPVTFSEDDVTAGLLQVIPENSQLNVTRRIKSHVIPKEAAGIQILSRVYEETSGLDGTPVTTTGATYARSMPNIVAFGPSFPGQKGIAHNKNEYMAKKDLFLNMEIYLKAICALAVADL
ncbi:Sapep family Mn(2+)-dependent dipeptidase [Enterococcus sp. LJL120]